MLPSLPLLVAPASHTSAAANPPPGRGSPGDVWISDRSRQTVESLGAGKDRFRAGTERFRCVSPSPGRSTHKRADLRMSCMSMRLWCIGLSLFFAVLALPVCAADIAIAGYGDSLTSSSSRWCGQVQAPDTCDWSHAVPGERTATGVARLIADLAAGALDPETTHVTLAWGANDIRRSDLDWDTDFEQPLRAAATAVIAAGFEPVLVVTLDQYQTSPGQSTLECDPFPLLQERLDAEFSPRVYAVAEDYDPNLIVVDLNAAYDSVLESTKCPGAWHAGFYKDHVHQTPAGYQFMAEKFIAAIEMAAAMPVPSIGPGPTGLLTCLLVSLGLWRFRR